ncbi:hypothetical protein FA95DRAFT_1308105 [Auriscalpium vulgare]|uniref:Uncharacterized protein n=1 Tax=Auriscalpium vulgare TaxID=40419 RepID=A0ACB8RS16_9AGAM|nr:hypothetical protein FA95DRAFT_1308105 [Auriscalpium vulgare]
MTWLGGSALVDFIISTAMIYLLFMKRKAVHFRHSELRINRLIRLSVETGLATTATAMCDLIVFVAAINANYHAFFTLLMCKVYSNALMTTLNSREYNSQSAATTTVQLIDMTSQLNAARDTSTRDRSTAIVHVSSETEVFGATTALDGEKPRVLGAEGSQPSLASFGGVGKD